MNQVRIVISYNGRWEQFPDGSQRFIGSITGELSIIPGSTCRTFIRNDDDVQFMLGEDRVIPQVCVSVTERTVGDMIGNDIPRPENTQQFGSFSGSNQGFTQRSATEGGENMCGVPPVTVNHTDLVEPQIVDVFGCRIEQYNEHYNEHYNEQNNHPNHDVDNDANNEHVDDMENVDEEPEQIQPRGRRVQGVSYTAPDMAGTSEVRYNITASDSDNVTTWVISRAEAYSFGTFTSNTFAVQEPRTMIYKGQFFSE
ncbi:hypothetical protein LWI28_000942 [Acer negundo]|uniref:Uncharacterized protein n=1 Tax=Acer negundo TaxID=4023 RepID=A0AAD5NRV0_ACENE|nr:hypothetical protein LWI28_000942 [Acer negundo]